MKKIWVCAAFEPAFGEGEDRSFRIIIEEGKELRHIAFIELSEIAKQIAEERGELGLSEVWIIFDKPCDVALTPYCTFPQRYESLTEREKKQLLQHLSGSTFIQNLQIIENWHK